MVVKKLGFVFLLMGMFIGSFPVCRSETYHPVNVSVPELCRYRITEVTTEKCPPDLEIVQMRITVLSNSSKPWQLVAYPEKAAGPMEWSIDQQVWYQINSGGSLILTGERSAWDSHYFYFRSQRQNALSFQIHYKN